MGNTMSTHEIPVANCQMFNIHLDEAASTPKAVWPKNDHPFKKKRTRQLIQNLDAHNKQRHSEIVYGITPAFSDYRGIVLNGSFFDA